MSKKYIAVSVAVVAIAAFSLFSLMNAFALNMNSDFDMSAGTSAVKLCKQARRSYGRDVKSARAKGLSLQLPSSEIRNMVRQIKSYRNQICREARAQRKQKSGKKTTPSSSSTPTSIMVNSSAFASGAAIPLKHAFTEVSGGQNVSPQLSWSVNNPDIQSFALLMYDPHPTAQNWVHWCVTQIPATTTSIAEGASGTMDMPGYEWSNGSTTGYEGPYPPAEDDAHPYIFKIVGLNMVPITPTDANTGACTFNSFTAATSGLAVAEGTYEGTFDR